MTQTLILIRHGHRDTSQRQLDNGLDDKGRDQAKLVRRFFAERFTANEFKKGLWFVSSPKIRCVETLLPSAKSAERPVDVHPDLDEQSGRETERSLEARVGRFLDEWTQSKRELTLLCSHGDWLPLATARLLGVRHDFKKGSWLEIEAEGGHFALKWYIPTFRPFFKVPER